MRHILDIARYLGATPGLIALAAGTDPKFPAKYAAQQRWASGLDGLWDNQYAGALRVAAAGAVRAAAQALCCTLRALANTEPLRGSGLARSGIAHWLHRYQPDPVPRA